MIEGQAELNDQPAVARTRRLPENKVPNLAIELGHLEAADRHVALARDRLASIEDIECPSGDSRARAHRLRTLRQTLAAFEAHREQIVKTIAGIRDGSLPRS